MAIRVDRDGGLEHMVKGTSANVHDARMTAELLTEEETVNRDSGYLGVEKRTNVIVHDRNGQKIHCQIYRRPSQVLLRGSIRP